MVNYEICYHAECTSSPNSDHQLCKMQHEEDNWIDGEMHKFCKKCVGKKYRIGAVTDIEVADLPDTKNNNAAIANERCDALHNNSDEANIEIANERHGM